MYPYQPKEAKSNLDSTFGKVEMEHAASVIIQQAKRQGDWNVRILMCGYENYDTIYGLELLAGYGWLIFLPDEERWTVTPEFIKRACQSDEERRLEEAIINYFEPRSSDADTNGTTRSV